MALNAYEILLVIAMNHLFDIVCITSPRRPNLSFVFAPVTAIFEAVECENMPSVPCPLVLCMQPVTAMLKHVNTSAVISKLSCTLPPCACIVA